MKDAIQLFHPDVGHVPSALPRAPRHAGEAVAKPAVGLAQGGLRIDPSAPGEVDDREQQVADLDRKVLKLARYDVHVRRFMITPGAVRSPHFASRRRLTIQRASGDRIVLALMLGRRVGVTLPARSTGVVGSRSVVTRCFAVTYLKQPASC